MLWYWTTYWKIATRGTSFWLRNRGRQSALVFQLTHSGLAGRVVESVNFVTRPLFLKRYPRAPRGTESLHRPSKSSTRPTRGARTRSKPPTSTRVKMVTQLLRPFLVRGHYHHRLFKSKISRFSLRITTIHAKIVIIFARGFHKMFHFTRMKNYKIGSGNSKFPWPTQRFPTQLIKRHLVKCCPQNENSNELIPFRCSWMRSGWRRQRSSIRSR